MISYDPKVINDFADALYNKADRIVRGMMLRYGFIGFVVGLIVGLYIGNKLSPGIVLPLVSATAFTIISSYIGKKAGEEKAFTIRLEAQVALCQVEIEKNSRGHKEKAA